MRNRQPLSTDASDKDFNIAAGQNMAADGLSIVRRGRELGDAGLVALGEQMMNTGVEHARIWAGR